MTIPGEHDEIELHCEICGNLIDSSGCSLEIPSEDTKDEDICEECGGPL